MKRYFFVATSCLILIGQPLFATLSVSSYSLNSLPPVTQEESPNLYVSSLSLSDKALSETNTTSNLTFTGDTETDFTTISPSLVGKPYNYPNPFRAGEQTQLGYELSKPMEIEIKIFNSIGMLVFQRTCVENSLGGNAGYNKIDLDPSSFKYPLSAGIYFFVLMFKNQVIGKGKMAVTP